MTSQDIIAKYEEHFLRKQAAAKKAKIFLREAQDRLRRQTDKHSQLRESVIGKMLIERAAFDSDCAKILCILTRDAGEGSEKRLFASWTPDLTAVESASAGEERLEQGALGFEVT